jgi:hypothetical protein
MRSVRRIGGTSFAAIAVALLAAVSLAAGNGWVESGGGGGSLPERKVAFTDNGISLEVVMAPGTSVQYERPGKWPATSSASIRMYADNVNATGNGYVPSEAFFPVSVTFAFGEDSLSLGARQRISLFFQYIWSGFPPSGIRLTYVWGNRVPPGSMYRLREEETVFVLATAEEAGKEIGVVRRLAEDFRAAYARVPKGPVTKVLVRARRPSEERGSLKASVSLGFPRTD